MRATWLVGLLGAALLAASAGAPDAFAADPGRTRADKLDRAGKDAFRHGAYGDAAIAFKAAYEASPSPGRLFNLGKAYQRAGDLPGAIRTFERYLEEAPDAEDTEDVSEALGFLRTKVPVTLTTYPAGARFEVRSGDDRWAGEAPWSAWLEPGRCEVLVELE